MIKGPQGQIEVVSPQSPWQALLYGQGSAHDWCEVFIELLRQQRIDACVLGMNVPVTPEVTEQIPWGVGVLIDDKIYVFFAGAGVPLVMENDVQLTPENGLVFSSIVTLDQLKAKPEILNAYVSDVLKQTIADKMINETVLMIPYNPIAHSQRMKIMEKSLTGANQTILYGSYDELKARFAQVAPDYQIQQWGYTLAGYFEALLNRGVTDARMLPFLVTNDVKNPNPLWKGRLLYFAGSKVGSDSASTLIQSACISDRELMRDSHLTESQYFLHQVVNFTANYWLGHIAFEESQQLYNAGNKNAALRDAFDYVNKKILSSEYSAITNEWRSGSIYHLGRVCELQGRYKEAIQFYMTPLPVMQTETIGWHFRAKCLRRLADIPEISVSNEEQVPDQTEAVQ